MQYATFRKKKRRKRKDNKDIRRRLYHREYSGTKILCGLLGKHQSYYVLKLYMYCAILVVVNNTKRLFYLGFETAIKLHRYLTHTHTHILFQLQLDATRL